MAALSLDQPVVEFTRPLALQKGLRLRPANRELGTVAPLGIHRVGRRHALGIARIPGVFGQAHLLPRRLCGEGRQRRA
jgi:hypothetical protein